MITNDGLSESRIQQDIVIWYTKEYCLKFHSPRCLIFHVPNQNQQRLTNIGVLGGVSDLMVCHRAKREDAGAEARQGPGVWMCVEVKDATGKQSEKQKEYEQRVTNLGTQYIVVRSLDEFKRVIQIEDERQRQITREQASSF